MSYYLPAGQLKQLDEISRFDVPRISDQSDVGFILEVELLYPNNLYDEHDDLPLAAKQFTLNT